MRRKNQRLLALGVFLVIVSIFLALSFQFFDNHRWYWNAAHILCLFGILLAASGGLLVGHNIARKRKRRIWLAVLGSILGLAWIVSGIVAVNLTFLGMDYFNAGDGYIGWDSYHGDYLVGWYNIRLFQLATLTGLLGGFATGVGLAPKRKEDNSVC